MPRGSRTLLPPGLHAPAAAVAVLAATVVAVLAVQYAGDTVAGSGDGNLDRAVDALPGHGVARTVIVFGSPTVVTRPRCWPWRSASTRRCAVAPRRHADAGATASAGVR